MTVQFKNREAAECPMVVKLCSVNTKITEWCFPVTSLLFSLIVKLNAKCTTGPSVDAKHREKQEIKQLKRKKKYTFYECVSHECGVGLCEYVRLY